MNKISQTKKQWQAPQIIDLDVKKNTEGGNTFSGAEFTSTSSWTPTPTS